MTTPEQTAIQLQNIFNQILQDQMQGIPIVNHSLNVQSIGFQEYQNRTLGIVITPWFMNLFLLPGKTDQWSDMESGKKIPQQFPSGTYKFMVNDFDGIGPCLTHSLYSPMQRFSNQQQAIQVANEFMTTLMTKQGEDASTPIDEELLGKVMRGEPTPEIDLDNFEEIKPHKPAASLAKDAPIEKLKRSQISRRDLLRGRLRHKA